MDSGGDVDEVLVAFLSALARKGQRKRAEGILSPKQEAAPVEAAGGEGEEAQMAELEQMLAEAPSGETEMPCECGKTPCEC